jgi:hypothetical protein
VFDLAAIDLEEIATALEDQTDYEHRWLLDPRTAQVAFWTSDTGERRCGPTTPGQGPPGAGSVQAIQERTL